MNTVIDGNMKNNNHSETTAKSHDHKNQDLDQSKNQQKVKHESDKKLLNPDQQTQNSKHNSESWEKETKHMIYSNE